MCRESINLVAINYIQFSVLSDKKHETLAGDRLEILTSVYIKVDIRIQNDDIVMNYSPNKYILCKQHIQN